MLIVRPGAERGYADHGWLQSFHSFSFAGYYDPDHMGWGNLRVINEDWIAPGMGFGTHGHRDMEIITYVLEGTLAHRDSMGHAQPIRAGEVQRMSAGTGVQHSEFNPDNAARTHLLQIWITPHRADLAPSYSQTRFDDAAKLGRLCLIAGPEAEPTQGPEPLRIQADARLYATRLDSTQSVQQALAVGRKAYVHLIEGQLRVNGSVLHTGDAALLADEPTLTLDGARQAHALVFDLQG
ncbi:MAG: pirin family protein [Rhodoferax sp.]